MKDAIEGQELSEDDSPILTISRSEGPAKTVETERIEDKNQESSPIAWETAFNRIRVDGLYYCNLNINWAVFYSIC